MIEVIEVVQKSFHAWIVILSDFIAETVHADRRMRVGIANPRLDFPDEFRKQISLLVACAVETFDGDHIGPGGISDHRFRILEFVGDQNAKLVENIIVSACQSRGMGADVVDVSASDTAIIRDNMAKFEKFGFGIEILNETEIILRKVPMLIAKVSPKEIIADILENIEGDIDRLEEKILITTSCKASVKAGQKLSIWQMQEIVKKWRSTKMPYTCPHGRPISHIIPHKEIAAFFMRQA